MSTAVRGIRRIVPTTPSARASVRDGAQQIARALFAPRTRLDIVQWCEAHIELPPSSPVPGPLSYAYTPYLSDILRALASPTFSYGAVLKAGQIGFSVAVLCAYLAWLLSESPENVALMLPTEGEAESFSKDKIRNLIDGCKPLHRALGQLRSRDTDNTILEKRTRAGTILRLLGSNSTSRTRSWTSAVLLFDEIDEYEADAEQGDIIQLMRRAQTQYAVGRAKTMLGSTPTTWLDAPDGDEATREDRGTGSRAFREYLNGDRRQWWWTCASCGDRWVPDWFTHVRWPKEGTVLERAAQAYYVCPHGCAIPRTEQQRMVRAGEWRPSRPGALYPSWDIQGLLSFAPDMQIDRLAVQFMAAGKDPVALRPFYNLKLGRVFKEQRSPIVISSLRDRREKYAAEVPNPVGVLTMAVDVQRGVNARLEVLIVGWGAGEESWRIHHFRLVGDTTQLVAAPGQPPSPWQRLDALIQRVYVHEAGVGLRIARTVIDSADGEMTDLVYQYCKPRAAWGVVPLRGERSFTGLERPKTGGALGLIRPGKAGDSGVRLILVDTYAAKDRLFGRLKLVGSGPGVMHWPLLPDDSQEFPLDYWGQFRNEVKKTVPRYKNAIETVDLYEKIGPNETIDLEVQSMGALYDLGDDVRLQLGQKAAQVQAQGAAARVSNDLDPNAPILTAPVERSREIARGRERPR